MGYENPHGSGYEVSHATAVYNVDSHGDLGAHYNSISNSDLPNYAHGFYSPTEHEQMSELKYSRIEIGYDKGLRNFKEAVDGIPLIAYIPQLVESSDSGSASPRDLVIKKPSRTIVDEIMKAQAEIIGQKATELRLEETEIEEIIIKRRFKRRTLSIRK